ncbi:hypothetical protein [Streptomyces niger]|nr:hypothetical protein [Streptomyces niger]
MNTGWVVYGILLAVGAFLVFDPRKGIHPTTARDTPTHPLPTHATS